MKLIGAGLPRTATTTQMIALEMLGLPCYHMRDMMADREKSIPQWRAALEGNGPWDELFDLSDLLAMLSLLSSVKDLGQQIQSLTDYL